MGDERTARFFFGATSLLVCAGLILQVILSATATGGSFATPQGRVFNFFCFFTVQSNIVVAITTGMLALRLRRSSTWFCTFRLDGVVAIAITGVVFHLALSDLQELTGWEAVADFVLHTASPLLTVAGWLLFGPRGHLSWRITRLAVIAPICWLIFALVRGALVHDVNGRNYYAYPFMNAQVHGYPVVLFNASLVALLFLGMCAAAVALDARLPSARHS